MYNLIIFLILLVTGFFSYANAESDKKVFRYAYFEAYPFTTFQGTYKALKEKVLIERGLDKELVEVAYFSPGRGCKEEWNTVAKMLLERDDVDFLLIFGTAATDVMLSFSYPEIFCKTEEQKESAACKGVLGLSEEVRKGFKLKPMFSSGVSDAVKSGFVVSKNEHHSGVDNFNIRIVPNRYKRMFEIFYDEVGFNKLGLLYYDTPSGRNYTNLKDAYSVAEQRIREGQRGFEIIEEKLPSDNYTNEDCRWGIENLIKKGIDAFYIPSLTCFEWKKDDPETLLKRLLEKKVKTFARQGSEDVKAGAMLGFSSVDFTGRANFLIEHIIKVLKEDVSPRELIMEDNAPPKIALNLEAAEKCEHDFSFDILGASDEIYQSIELPKEEAEKTEKHQCNIDSTKHD